MVPCGVPWRSCWSSSTGGCGVVLRLRRRRCSQRIKPSRECDNKREFPHELRRTLLPGTSVNKGKRDDGETSRKRPRLEIALFVKELRSTYPPRPTARTFALRPPWTSRGVPLPEKCRTAPDRIA